MMFKRFFCCFTISLIPLGLSAQFINFSPSEIVIAEGSRELQTSAEVLKEVIRERSGESLPIRQGNAQIKKNKAIILGLESSFDNKKEYTSALSALALTGREGFKVVEIGNQILIAGHDYRGVLYGVGYLLRKMELRRKEIKIPSNLNVSSTPDAKIRGHQLGYRPKTNAYDAWSVEQFDHYIRDLILFGANSIEIMPPRTDDDFENSHMKLPAIQMIAEQSKIAQKYGLDVWMWYPNMGGSYEDPDSIRKELEERREVFKAVPKLDNLFVPGGDPGDLEPEVLFAWLKKVAKLLRQYHPQAKIWVSPQVFKPSERWYSSFYEEVNKKQDWFGGVVYGPWVKEPIREVRARVRKDLPLRRYPDITHNFSSQYPVPNWDLAMASIQERESYNPRPLDEKHIHNVFARYADGSISYSEGINDDINKFVWSGQDWDSTQSVMETLRDLARLFIGPDDAEEVALGWIDLEQNWTAPTIANDRIRQTLLRWEKIKEQADSTVLTNFRFQMGLLRAYLDAYIQRRLIYETELEQEARDLLNNAGEKGSLAMISQAIEKLKERDTSTVGNDFKEECLVLSDSVYNSIRSQLTVKVPQLAKDGRGNFIDFMDRPLNDARWLIEELTGVKTLSKEEARLEKIDSLLNVTNPYGGVYVDLGGKDTWKYVVREKNWEEDPGSLESAFIDFGTTLKGEEWVDIIPYGFDGQAIPRSWTTLASTLYNTPLKMHFEDLDSNVNYKIRVAYTGHFLSHVKLMANNHYLVHDYIKMGEKPIYEFSIPQEEIRQGNLELEWSCLPGERGTQVGAIWLLKDQ